MASTSATARACFRACSSICGLRARRARARSRRRVVNWRSTARSMAKLPRNIAAEGDHSFGCGGGELWSCRFGCGEQGDDGDGSAAVGAFTLCGGLWEVVDGIGCAG